jgi:Tfp pilus assembly protein PilN
MKRANAEQPIRGKAKAPAGVVYTGDGSLAYARLKIKSGRWAVEAVDSWQMSNVPKTTLRLSGGAALGVCAEWHRRAPSSALEPPASGVGDDVNPYLHSAEYDFFLESLSGCVTSAVTDDSFLLTLPLAFCDNPAASFLSVYSENGVAAFGVVIAKKLEAVFSFPCSGASCVEASAARVRRYWSCALKRDDFPQKAIVFDSQNNSCDGLDIEHFTLPKELRCYGAIKAAGAALAAQYPKNPAFRLPPEHTFRNYRRLLLLSSTVLLCLVAAITLISAAANFQAGRKLGHSEERYYSRLSENKSLQTLNQTADELSAKILSIQKAYTQSTRWGNLLLLLSEIKPDDLFLDRLGSDNIQGSENNIRLALSGWSRTETSVTDFISGLQASNYIDNVSLSSMERDSKDKNICRFKILCAMRLFKD